MGVDWNHVLSIKVQNGECWVLITTSGSRPCTHEEANGISGVDGSGDVDRFFVRVPITGKSDDILISVHQGMESDAKLVQTVLWLDVGDDIGKAIFFFEIGEFTLKPFDL